METQHLSPTQQKAESDSELRLNPGAPERKPRSAGRLCLWLTLVFIVFAGSAVTYLIVSSMRYALRNPHSKLYHKTPEPEVIWSNVVRPMITQGDSFDIVATVWVRDDEGNDGGMYVDGEERPERLLYSGTLFRNLSLESKNVFSNVSLRVPIKHL
jgi:hypothetical protein